MSSSPEEGEAAPAREPEGGGAADDGAAAPGSRAGAWAARCREAAEAGGMCLVCLRYFGHTAGLCSQCHDFVQSQPLPWEALTERGSPEELYEVAGRRAVERERRAAEDLAATMEALDRVSRPLAMPPQTFGHFQRSLRARELSPSTLARELLSLGRPLITVDQATQLLDLLASRGESDYRYWHVLCSRVVDPWNLSGQRHGIGHCYYGYLEADPFKRVLLAKLIGANDHETLAAVFWRLLRHRVGFAGGLPQWRLDGSFNHENFWSDDDLSFVRGEMREHGVDVVLDVPVTCCYDAAGGNVECTAMTGSTVGTFPVPHGEEPFGKWLGRQVSQAMPLAGGPGQPRGRLCLLKADGEIFWRGKGVLSAFEEVCQRQRQCCT